ncbi:MAG: head-tail connector protein [Holosporales bacterium]|jgi:hypothetical protein|nr:head-tail connector protein [Holosporales bacterium]
MLTLLEESQVLAVSLKKAKNYLRLDHTEDDENLTLLIRAATYAVEQALGRSLMAKTWQKTVFIKHTRDGTGRITLPFPPLIDVLSVEIKTGYERPPEGPPDDPPQRITKSPMYSRQSGDFRQSHRYLISKDKMVPTVVVHGMNCTVKVKYTAGYGDRASMLPPSIRQAILILVADMYENRTIQSCIPANAFVKLLLAPYRIVSLA